MSDSATPWIVAHQLLCPVTVTLGDLPGPGIKPVSLSSPALQAGSLPLSHCFIEERLNEKMETQREQRRTQEPGFFLELSGLSD